MLDNSIESGLQRPLRTLLLLDSLRVHRWAASLILEMLASPVVTVVGIAIDSDAEGASDRTWRSRFRHSWRDRANIFANWYFAVDGLRYPVSGEDPFEVVDIRTALAGISCVNIAETERGPRPPLESAAVATVDALTPDVGISFRANKPPGGILQLPRFGIWSFHHGNTKANFVNSGGFWEVFLGLPATGARLIKVSEEPDGETVLANTWTVTDPVSVTQNRALLYRSAAPLLMRKLRELHRRGGAALEATSTESNDLTSFSVRNYRPRLRHIALGLLRMAAHVAGAKLKDLRSHEQWRLEYCFGDANVQRTNIAPQTEMHGMRPLIPPGDRLWADPFPVEHDGSYAVFFEELLFGHPKARIAMTNLSPDAVGEYALVRTVLDLPFHVSYPFVFKHDSVWYMLPEMADHGTQKLFRAQTFPDSWEFDRNIDLGQPVVDATLHFQDGRWWLFAGTCPAPETLYNELSIFYSTSPLGPWVPHVANPVLSDARSARPAGKLYWSGGVLIRPAQDCTPEYGDAMILKRIVRLDVEGYEEVAAGKIEPNWAPQLRGTHTLNAAGRLTVTDSRVLRAK
jgi:hypothetical protein